MTRAGLASHPFLATLRRWMDSGWSIVLLVGIGVALRGFWTMHRFVPNENGEAEHVAVAVASGRGFADPYFVGSGPTAHLMPTTPLLAGGVMRVFGIQSTASIAVLTAIALLQVMIAYLAAFWLFGRLGTSRPARVSSLAWLCLVPPFLYQEALSYQFWDGGLALALGMVGMLHVVTLSRRPSKAISTNHVDREAITDDLTAGALAGITFFVSPIIGLAVGLCYVCHYLGERRWLPTLRAATFAVLILAALVTPWAIRNHQVFGEFIPLRDNAGLELAIANHDRALTGDDPQTVLYDRMAEIHPVVGASGRAAFEQQGETAYYKALQGQTIAWIAAHPDGFLRLFSRHVREMFVPSGWELGHTATLPRAIMIGAANILGILGIVSALIQRRRLWLYPAIFVGVIGLAYGPFQPVSRYLYPIYVILCFCAGDALARIVAKVYPGSMGLNSPPPRPK